MSSLPMAYRVGARVKKVRRGPTKNLIPVGSEGIITSLSPARCFGCGLARDPAGSAFCVSYGRGNSLCGCDDFAGSPDWCEVIQPEGYKTVEWASCLWQPDRCPSVI